MPQDDDIASRDRAAEVERARQLRRELRASMSRFRGAVHDMKLTVSRCRVTADAAGETAPTGDAEE